MIPIPRRQARYSAYGVGQRRLRCVASSGGRLGTCNAGLIAQHESGEIEGPLGLSWNTNDWNFLREQEDPPESVNPSLWRHGRHNAIHGLFEVAENVWQARGYDISNITFIKGDEGWVIVDPLTTSFTAKACLDLANATLGERPVTTVLYTHSHTDHYGGILGVTSTDEVDKGNVRILAPEGFMREAVAENLIAGPAMGRRAFYQFGMLLPPGPQGHIDCGLGKWIRGAARPGRTDRGDRTHRNRTRARWRAGRVPEHAGH